MFKRIMVPLDGSSVAEQALPSAVELAQAVGASLHLVGVLFPIDVTWGIGVVGSPITRAETDRAHTNTYLSQKAKSLKEKGIEVSFEVREGPIAPQIVAAAEEAGVDLILMSTHGHSGVEVFLGSIADKVARRSKKIPVMLIPITGD